ncbi:hypothetical protein CGI18_15050 [Vibrio parahaemolyticus]|nr:hypothetical protein CGI18_15050 [Vibrio parahaemolyticus]
MRNAHLNKKFNKQYKRSNTKLIKNTLINNQLYNYTTIQLYNYTISNEETCMKNLKELAFRERLSKK